MTTLLQLAKILFSVTQNDLITRYNEKKLEARRIKCQRTKAQRHKTLSTQKKANFCSLKKHRILHKS